MKLEPGRASLSGRPEFLRPAAPTQVVAPVPVQRKCALCGLKDVVELIEDEPFHSITVELRFIDALNEEQAKQKITGYLRARGWSFKMHLGRFAMVRDVCRPCLIAHEEIAREFRRKKANELKSSLNSESYYLALCGD